MHRRAIEVQVFTRGDGLWEVDATLRDTKTRDTPVAGGIRAAGDPVHDMTLRLVVNEKMDILEAGSATRGMPYPGLCDQHGDAYRALVGLNLMQNFRQGVRERVGGAKACTHITEMAAVLPTAVVQGFVGEVFDPRASGPEAAQPFQIDRCHALKSSGEAVRLHYPQWFRPAPQTTPA